jgi:hypothetical protein
MSNHATAVNAFHKDYVKTFMPEFLTKIRVEQQQIENGKKFGAKSRQREPDLDKPNGNTVVRKG